MATRKSRTGNDALASLLNGDSLPSWWMQQWLESTAPITRMQLAWLQTMSEAMQHEAEFLKVVATSSEKLARCAWDPEALRDPSALSSCYQQAASEVANAAARRFSKVSELSHDLRERIWDEI
ncbi:hypothetical protein [Modicisalibacter coralii]|uniref:hypothetical protein n=1 Tax=Modicisalibacter coralii TaxID=2304602 RepID=UPI00100C0C56|nr:hypothetical protein [Halomonas coralii]